MHLSSIVLENDFVRLEPFDDSHKAAVKQALDQDPVSWNDMVTAGFGEHFEAWWMAARKAQASGSRIPYAVRRLSDGAIVGTTSLYEIKPEHHRCEVGSTFYSPEVRGTKINPSAKLLLLNHAFNSGVVRVEIIIDSINAISQAAIRKMGASFEGVLRKHKRTWTGRMRDTVQFAILVDDEWPRVKASLEARLTG